MAEPSTTVHIEPHACLLLSVGRVQKTSQTTQAPQGFERVCSGVPGASSPCPGRKLALYKVREHRNAGFPEQQPPATFSRFLETVLHSSPQLGEDRGRCKTSPAEKPRCGPSSHFYPLWKSLEKSCSIVLHALTCSS